MKTSTLSFVVVLAATGCGGLAAKYQVSDASIAALSQEDKKAVLAANVEMESAKSDLERANAEYKQVTTELKIAENDYSQSKLRKKNAKLTKEAATAASDENRKTAASRELAISEKAIDAADAKVDWLAKKKKWAKAQKNACERHVIAVDARRQYEKARLASSKNIMPDKKFSLGKFEAQNFDEMKEYNDAKLDADKMLVEVNELDTKQKSKQLEYQQAQGSGT